jgi:hypothetical protein
MEKWGKFINPQKTQKKNSNRKYAGEILILILKNVLPE